MESCENNFRSFENNDYSCLIWKHELQLKYNEKKDQEIVT